MGLGRRLFLRVILAYVLLSCEVESSIATPHAAPDQRGPEQPRLIVLLVIDQFPASYIKRFLPFFSQGLKQLISEGVVFENGFHDHGITETCPGHATISTGRYPSVHGIVSNHWYERESKQYRYCVHDGRGAIGPYALRTKTFADRLRLSHPAAKIVSVSGKDRAAVLLGGRSPDLAAWFSADTLAFETSSWYQHSRPEATRILGQFSARALIGRYQGIRWRSSPISVERLQAAEIVSLQEKKSLLDRSPFAADKPTRGSKRGNEFILTPFLDDYTGFVAGEVVRELRMGSTPGRTDLLAVSFSAIDYIGHRFGPNSREMLEALIAVDKTIGDLVSNVEKSAGEGNVLIALTSDHGIQPLPEVQQKLGRPGGRITQKDRACVSQVTSSVPVLAAGRWFSPVSFWLPEHSATSKDDLGRVQKRLDAAIMSCGWVARVIIPALLDQPKEEAIPKLAADELHARESSSRHSVYPERAPDIHLIPHEGVTPELGSDAVHGSPYDYDTKVPIIFWRRGIEAKRSLHPIPTVIIAPILAEFAAIPQGESDAKPSTVAAVRKLLSAAGVSRAASSYPSAATPKRSAT